MEITGKFDEEKAHDFNRIYLFMDSFWDARMDDPCFLHNKKSKPSSLLWAPASETVYEFWIGRKIQNVNVKTWIPEPTTYGLINR